MRRRIIYLSSLLCLWAWTAQPVCAKPYSDRIAAVVNGDVILSSDIKKHQRPVIRSITNLPIGIVPPGKWPTEKEILDELIVIRLLEQEADLKGIKVGEKGVDASVEALRKRNRLTHDEFVLFLGANGVDYADYRKMMKRQFRLRKLITEEVTRKVPLSEEDAQQYFKRNQGKIEQEFKRLVAKFTAARPPRKEAKPEIPTHETRYVGGRVRLRQITLKIPPGAGRKTREKVFAKAKRIHREAVTGADFAKLARKYSQDPLAESGGDLGNMAYKDLRGSIQKMVQRMKKGDITPPIQAREAVFMFYLADAKGRKAKKVPIPEKIRKQLEKQWKEALEKRAARNRPNSEADAAAPEDRGASKRSSRTSSGEKKKPKKSLGILSPKLEKEYEKVRSKVIAILKTKKTQERMKEWIEELKKNSIIEVKL